jgi:hypothetical protein
MEAEEAFPEGAELGVVEEVCILRFGELVHPARHPIDIIICKRLRRGRATAFALDRGP